MDTLNSVKVVIYWLTRNQESVARIRQHFGITGYTTLNGHTPASIPMALMPMFEETARRGYFGFRRIEWTFNGSTYSW